MEADEHSNIGDFHPCDTIEQRKPGLHGLLLQEWAISTYALDCDCGSVIVPFLMPHGEPAVSRHPWNDRGDSIVGDTQVIQDLVASVCRQGLLQNVRDRPIIMAAGTDPARHSGKAEKWWLLSNAHAAEAVIQCAAKYPTNIYVQATLAKGLANCLVIDVRTPRDVCKWFKKMSNSFGKGSGFTWPECYREGKQALQQWEAALKCSTVNEQSCRSVGEFSLEARRWRLVDSRYPKVFKNQTVFGHLSAFISFIDEPKRKALHTEFFTMLREEVSWNFPGCDNHMFSVHLHTCVLALNKYNAVAQMNQQGYNQTFLAMSRTIFPRPVPGIQHGKPTDKKFMSWGMPSQNEAKLDVFLCPMMGSMGLKQKKLTFHVAEGKVVQPAPKGTAKANAKPKAAPEALPTAAAKGHSERAHRNGPKRRKVTIAADVDDDVKCENDMQAQIHKGEENTVQTRGKMFLDSAWAIVNTTLKHVPRAARNQKCIDDVLGDSILFALAGSVRRIGTAQPIEEWAQLSKTLKTDVYLCHEGVIPDLSHSIAEETPGIGEAASMTYSAKLDILDRLKKTQLDENSRSRLDAFLRLNLASVNPKFHPAKLQLSATLGSLSTTKARDRANVVKAVGEALFKILDSEWMNWCVAVRDAMRCEECDSEEFVEQLKHVDSFWDDVEQVETFCRLRGLYAMQILSEALAGRDRLSLVDHTLSFFFLRGQESIVERFDASLKDEESWNRLWDGLIRVSDNAVKKEQAAGNDQEQKAVSAGVKDFMINFSKAPVNDDGEPKADENDDDQGTMFRWLSLNNIVSGLAAPAVDGVPMAAVPEPLAAVDWYLKGRDSSLKAVPAAFQVDEVKALVCTLSAAEAVFHRLGFSELGDQGLDRVFIDIGPESDSHEKGNSKAACGHPKDVTLWLCCNGRPDDDDDLPTVQLCFVGKPTFTPTRWSIATSTEIFGKTLHVDGTTAVNFKDSLKAGQIAFPAWMVRAAGKSETPTMSFSEITNKEEATKVFYKGTHHVLGVALPTLVLDAEALQMSYDEMKKACESAGDGSSVADDKGRVWIELTRPLTAAQKSDAEESKFNEPFAGKGKLPILKTALAMAKVIDDQIELPMRSEADKASKQEFKKMRHRWPHLFK